MANAFTLTFKPCYLEEVGATRSIGSLYFIVLGGSLLVWQAGITVAGKQCWVQECQSCGAVSLSGTVGVGQRLWPELARRHSHGQTLWSPEKGLLARLSFLQVCGVAGVGNGML